MRYGKEGGRKREGKVKGEGMKRGRKDGGEGGRKGRRLGGGGGVNGEGGGRMEEREEASRRE